MSIEQVIIKGYADHVATQQQLSLEDGTQLEYLRWKKQGTLMRSVVYIATSNTLFVRGDYGVAAYQVSDPHGLSFWASTDIDYFKEKCVASPHGRGIDWNDWCPEQCRERIDAFMKKQHWENNGSKLGLMILARRVAHSKETFSTWLDSYIDDFMGQEAANINPYKWGEVPAFFLQAHHIGLQMAWKQLQEQS